jgi:hypothetical protein
MSEVVPVAAVRLALFLFPKMGAFAPLSPFVHNVYRHGLLEGKDSQLKALHRFYVWTYLYPLSGEGVIFDPPQVLGSYVCPTVGAYWLLAT